MTPGELFLSDAQLRSELERCVYCEEKPCTEACPADCSPADFIMAARGFTAADFARSAAMIMTKNPLGGVCGAVCPDTHCQAACSRVRFDHAIEIPVVQASIVARAKSLGVMPRLEETPPNGRRVAIVGAGPAGLAAAAALAQLGYAVDLIERGARAGGAASLIPPLRMDPRVLETDVDWLLQHSRIHLELGRSVADPAALLGQGYAAVLVAAGLHRPIPLGIEGEALALAANDYLADPGRHAVRGRVAVVGGGAIACDCAITALAQGASGVEMITLEAWSEMPLTPAERESLRARPVDLVGRTRVAGVIAESGRVSGLRLQRVTLAPGLAFHPSRMTDIPGAAYPLPGIEQLIVAIGNRPSLEPVAVEGVFRAGDGAYGPSTVVEAAASGKNAALAIDAWVRRRPAPELARPLKSRLRVPGCPDTPVPLDVAFFGRRLRSPFLLSAGPPTDGYAPMRKAYQAGWSGGS